MTSFTNTWDSALPAESEDVRLGADRIRDLKVDIVERMAVDHSFALTADDGAHKKVTLLEQAGNPGTVANTSYLYTKDVGGVTELFWYDSAGAIVQLTTAGVLKGPLSGNAATATTATTFLAQVTPIPATATSLVQSHSLGIANFTATLEFICLTAEYGYSIGDIVRPTRQYNGSTIFGLDVWNSTTQVGVKVLGATDVSIAATKDGSSPTYDFIPPKANCAYRFVL